MDSSLGWALAAANAACALSGMVHPNGGIAAVVSLAVLVIFLFLLEVRRWRDVRRLITRRQRILRVVEVQDAVVEAVDDRLAEGLRDIGMHDGDEVVAADVPHEAGGIVGVDRGLHEGVGGELDDVVASHEAVVVVESLEVVEVGVHHGHGAPAAHPALQFFADAEVARPGFREAVHNLIRHFTRIFNNIKYSCHLSSPSNPLVRQVEIAINCQNHWHLHYLRQFALLPFGG